MTFRPSCHWNITSLWATWNSVPIDPERAEDGVEV